MSMDAPSFEGIGSRRNYEWLPRWIRDSRTQRPTAHMPNILRGPQAKEEADRHCRLSRLAKKTLQLQRQTRQQPMNKRKQANDF